MSSRGYVDPNWPPPNGADDAPIIIYGYTPSTVLCYLAFAFFGIALVAHAWQLVKHRSWYFASFAFGIIMELIGYIPRYFSGSKNPYKVIYFVLQYFFIVCAPVAFTAAIYACLYKMARWASTTTLSGIGAKWQRPRWILWIFIVADVVTTGLQVAGAALIGVAESNNKDSSNANNILLAGLAVQTFSFLGYFVVFGFFLREISRDRSLRLTKSFKIFVAALLVASVLILVRTVFRLAETAEGVYGYLSTHEAYFGALEFAPVVIASLVLAVFHPGRLLSPEKLAYTASQVEKDAEAGRFTSPARRQL